MALAFLGVCSQHIEQLNTCRQGRVMACSKDTVSNANQTIKHGWRRQADTCVWLCRGKLNENSECVAPYLPARTTIKHLWYQLVGGHSCTQG